jgi:hypothetical protein
MAYRNRSGPGTAAASGDAHHQLQPSLAASGEVTEKLVTVA